ncbi:hypothetical protein ACFV42_14200 [Streptomyces solisilvae]
MAYGHRARRWLPGVPDAWRRVRDRGQLLSAYEEAIREVRAEEIA